MELPADQYVRSLPSDNSIVAFNFPFDIQAKAVDQPVVQEQENGDLIIEGYAISFDGLDREAEQFLPGCLDTGIKSFLAGPAALCFHHKHDKVLGKVLEMQQIPGKGYLAKARVDGAIASHPELGAIYHQIKSGTLNSYSLGGFFKRAMTHGGPRIIEADPTELSVTGVPVMANGTQFSVIAGKALTDIPFEQVTNDEGNAFNGMLSSLDSALDSLEQAFASVAEGKAAPEPKGDYDDRYTLALILALEQETNRLDDDDDSPGDVRVDALTEKVKVCLDEVSREAHSLAAKLGPLPKITYPESY